MTHQRIIFNKKNRRKKELKNKKTRKNRRIGEIGKIMSPRNTNEVWFRYIFLGFKYHLKHNYNYLASIFNITEKKFNVINLDFLEELPK